MELREAIAEIRKDKPYQNVERYGRAVGIILEADNDGTLIPADQCFSVKEGYNVFAIQTYNKEHDRWDYPVPLPEALEIRSADDVRREAVEECLAAWQKWRDGQADLTFTDTLLDLIKGGDDV